MALPTAYSPVSIALRVIGARKPHLHDKAVDLEDVRVSILLLLFLILILLQALCNPC
jgi:hypothetical protein